MQPEPAKRLKWCAGTVRSRVHVCEDRVLHWHPRGGSGEFALQFPPSPRGGHYPTFPFSPIVVLTTHNLHASVWTAEPLQACVKRNKLSLLFDFHRWTDDCELWEQQVWSFRDGKRWIVCVYFFRNHASQTAVAPSAKQRDSWALAVYALFLREHAFEHCCCLNIAKEVPEASLLAVETAIAPSRTGLSIADGGQDSKVE